MRAQKWSHLCKKMLWSKDHHISSGSISKPYATALKMASSIQFLIPAIFFQEFPVRQSWNFRKIRLIIRFTTQKINNANRKSPFWIGDTSSNGWVFQPVMLVETGCVSRIIHWSRVSTEVVIGLRFGSDAVQICWTMWTGRGWRIAGPLWLHVPLNYPFGEEDDDISVKTILKLSTLCRVSCFNFFNEKPWKGDDAPGCTWMAEVLL